jgi:hypothetical protein
MRSVVVPAAGRYGALLANELFWITHWDLTGQPRFASEDDGPGVGRRAAG